MTKVTVRAAHTANEFEHHNLVHLCGKLVSKKRIKRDTLLVVISCGSRRERKDKDGKRVKEVVNGKKVTVYDEVEKEIKKDVKVDNKKAIEKFKEMVESGMTSEKIAKAFNLETLKTMAASFDIEVTDEDTKLSIVEALMEEDEEPSED